MPTRQQHVPSFKAQRRQLNFVLAVDCSGSMRGEKIKSLNYAMRIALPAMRLAAADNPEVGVFLRVLRVGSSVEWQQPHAVAIEDYEWSELEAEGETSIGAALSEIGDFLGPEKLPGRQLPPIVVLISDGQPTDDFASGLEALLRSPYGKKAVRIGIAIGSDADLDALRDFIGTSGIAPLQAHNAEELVSRIAWATTTPVKTVSTPCVGVDAAGKAALTAPQSRSQAEPEGSSLIW